MGKKLMKLGRKLIKARGLKKGSMTKRGMMKTQKNLRSEGIKDTHKILKKKLRGKRNGTRKILKLTPKVRGTTKLKTLKS